jgi:anti-sigma B factor antagonist
VTTSADRREGATSLEDMVQRFSIECAQTETSCLLTLSGEIDIVSSPQLISAARDALRDGVSAVSINLSGVTFIDSTGLAALINIQRSVERARGRLAVVCPDGPVRRLFAISGTEYLLGVEPSASRAAA